MNDLPLGDLAKHIREMRNELFLMIKGEAQNNLVNKQDKDILHIEKKHKEIKAAEAKYLSMNGVFSAGYIELDTHKVSDRSLFKATISALSDSGKIIIERVDDNIIKIIIPLNKNTENTKKRIGNMIGTEKLCFNEKSVPIHDMIKVEKNACDYDF